MKKCCNSFCSFDSLHSLTVGTRLLSARVVTLYICLLEKKMMGNRNENGLKGQNNLAQGKRRRSVALGWRTGKRIVRGNTINNDQFFIRTKWCVPDYRTNHLLNFVRIVVSFLKNMISRTVLSVLPLPWARLSWPFRPRLVNPGAKS